MCIDSFVFVCFFLYIYEMQEDLTGVLPSLSGEVSGEGGSTTMLVTLQE